MFDENQLVEVMWNNFHKKWYESKGYKFTNNNDVFLVKAKDLKPSSNKLVDVVCDYCNEPYKTQYHVVNNGKKSGDKDSCHSCCAKKAHELGRTKRIKNRFSKIEKICKEQAYILITTIDEYINGDTIITYICPIHGVQSVKANYLCDGSGCQDCRLDRISEANRLTIDDVKNRIEDVNGNTWINQDEYVDYATPNLQIRCVCGNVYTTSLASYIHYNVTRCQVCSNSESKAETHIKNFLNANNVLFKQEYGFDDCRGSVKRLPFDFYIPELNTCIEFNGKQHYEPVEYFGGEELFKLRQKYDKTKEEYCRSHNIKLICIPYWEENCIDGIITKELNL